MALTSVSVLQSRFRELYSLEPEFAVHAPGRVNLIGEHTDYNEGYVFPAAIDFDIAIVGSRREDRQVRAYAELFGDSATFTLDELSPSSDRGWSRFLRGVADQLSATRELKGMNCIISGTVPIGSGLSSSAALQIAACLAFEAAGEFELTPVERALIGQMAEQKFAGVQVGIMDQFVSCHGRADHALLIDTRSLDFEPVPIPKGLTILVADTKKPRELVDSAYNDRRAECERAVEILKARLPGIRALRDVSIGDFEQHNNLLPGPLLSRARHVVSENQRVLESVTAIKNGDTAGFGELMYESHESLRDDYGVSCRELDVMVELAGDVDGVFGSRMTGAGFGGCTVSLAADEAVPSFRKHVRAGYRAATGREPSFYECSIVDGARRLK